MENFIRLVFELVLSGLIVVIFWALLCWWLDERTAKEVKKKGW